MLDAIRRISIYVTGLDRL
jgi:uncharacterized protein with HEPN domain